MSKADETTESVYDTTKSARSGRVGKNGGWRLEVEDDQRKLSWWAECTVGSNC
jgi:hypothetical protein